MSEEKPNGADVDVNIAGQRVNLRNIKSLNTLATVATLIVVCVLGYAFYVHAGESRDAAKDLVQAMKEMTQAVREGNCLTSYQGPQDQRAAFCKQVTR